MQYPLVPPTAAQENATWTQFSITTLGFVPSAATPGPTTLQLWQDFLARRYRRIKSLNTVYQTTWAGFESVPLPNALPFDGAPLADWFQFESVVLRMQSAAHRFTVLLPVPLSLAFDPEEHQRRMDLGAASSNWKAGHTLFLT